MPAATTTVTLPATATVEEALALVQNGSWTIAEYAAWDASRPKAAAPAGKLTLKVSRKGALSLYGMGQWPITLYVEQWERLFGHREQIEAFIASNPVTAHPAEEKDGKLVKVAQKVRLKRKGEAEGAHVIG